MMFWHQTSFPLRYIHENWTSQIGKPFSIDLNDQNQVPYCQKHTLYRKNWTPTLFWQQIAFPLRSIHENWTSKIGKPFSIDLNCQDQVPYGQNDGLYKDLSKNIEKYRKITARAKKISKKKIISACSGGRFEQPALSGQPF